MSCLFFLITFVSNFLPSEPAREHQQFSHLARSFLSGKLYFLDDFVNGPEKNFIDTAKIGDKFYWHLGPFPALLLVPFVELAKLIGFFFYQGYLQFLITMLIFFLCFKLARKFSYSTNHALYLAFAFCFASVYQFTALVTWSWYFAQTVTAALIFLSLFEYLTKRRFWLIGILFGLVLMTRISAAPGILFFVVAALVGKDSALKEKIRSLTQLLAPILVALIILFGYNFLRFGNVLETGYQLSNNYYLTDQQKFEQLNYGLFDLRNIPTNLYYYFIKTPDPILLEQESSQGNTYLLKPPYLKVNYPGVSFFVVAPIFLYVFRAKKTELVKLALIPIGVILLILLAYYWPGWVQVGPRYLLDLLPFAFLILLQSFPNSKLSTGAKALIILSSIFNLYLFASLLA